MGNSNCYGGELNYQYISTQVQIAHISTKIDCVSSGNSVFPLIEVCE